MHAVLPPNEHERLDALRKLSLLDTGREQAFDDIVALAAQICETPIAAISLVDETRQWFKAAIGLGNVTETPRECAFCAHAILTPGEITLVPDAFSDPRFFDNTLVTGEPGIRFYAGVPLLTEENLAIGVLNVIDRVPRTLSDPQLNALAMLGRQASAQIEIKRSVIAKARYTAELSEADRQVMRGEQLFQSAVDSMVEGLIVYDGKGRVQVWNQSAQNILGLSVEQMRGRNLLEEHWRSVHEDFSEVPPEERPGALSLKDGQSRRDVLVGISHPEAGLKWVRVNTVPLINDSQRRPFGVVVSFSDVTEKTQQDQLSRRLTAIVDSSEDAIMAITLDDIIVNWNPGAERLFGYSTGEMIGSWAGLLFPENACETLLELHQRIISGHRIESQDKVLRDKVGNLIHMSVSYSPIKSASGNDVGIALIARDITDRIRYESQIASYNAQLQSQMAELEKANKALEALSTTDGLTGLLNHRAFQERLAEEFQRAHRYGHDMSVVMLDVDNFKQFNDTFGHPEGDTVLRIVSRIAAETARTSDIAARYGGEEFAVILTETSSDSAVAFAERLRIAIQDAEWDLRPITVSIGVSGASLDFADQAQMVVAADKALYESKRSGRNRVTLYSALQSASR